MNPIVDAAVKRTQMDINQRKRKDAMPQPRSVKEVSSERLSEKMMEAVAPKTGYPELDYLIKGFVPGHLYTLTGDTNVGKTTLACNFAIRVARQGKKVLYFALEPENTVVDYLASVRTDKTFQELTDSDIEEDDGNIFIYGKQEVSAIDDLVDIIRHTDAKYDLIIIDHVGYFVTTLHNTVQEQSNNIKKLAGLAKEKQCAIMMIAHLRKKAPNAKKEYLPSSDDIAGSASFKQDSTEVMIVTRKLEDENSDDVSYSNEGYLYVTKTKCGPNGRIQLKFQPRKANITTPDETREYLTYASNAFSVPQAGLHGQESGWVPTYNDQGQPEDPVEEDMFG